MALLPPVLLTLRRFFITLRQHEDFADRWGTCVLCTS
jgi:hypothetical protein